MPARLAARVHTQATHAACSAGRQLREFAWLPIAPVIVRPKFMCPVMCPGRLQVGNQTATTVALACLKDQDLASDINQMAIRDCGGMEVLVNLLEAQELKCKVKYLKIM